MKYFITGATGFVGGALARKLREPGHEVQASVRTPEKAKDLQALGVKLFKGDVTNNEPHKKSAKLITVRHGNLLLVIKRFEIEGFDFPSRVLRMSKRYLQNP